MLFTSYTFIGFIALLFMVYYLIPKKYQWVLLLLASYIFYSFAGVKYLLYIFFTSLSTYLISNKVSRLYLQQTDYLQNHKGELSRPEKKAYKAGIKKIQWRWLLLCLFLNIGILAVIKYTNFTINNINYISTALGKGQLLSFWNIALPMGISFYTFQTMGYMIDVYRGKYPAEKNFFRLALFVSFFPQLVQGPISRFDDLSKTLFEAHDFDKENILFGLQRILWGFFKKLVIADRLLVAVTTIIGDSSTYQGVFVFIGMLLYAFELYADFTGGIDITIGIAQVLGVKVKENFMRPYFAKSTKEYWRRWHITMGTWFKDYVYYPLAISPTMLKFSKFSKNKFGSGIGKRLPVYVATLATWYITGLWHGANWNFIVWGLMNAVVILISQEFEPLYDRFHKKFKVKGLFTFRLFQVIRTVLLMSSIRLFDCYRDVPQTFKMFGTMFTNFNIKQAFNGSMLELGLSMADYVIVLVGLLLMLGVSLSQRSGSVRKKIAKQPAAIRYLSYYALFISTIVFGAYGIGYEASQFIYNQF